MYNIIAANSLVGDTSGPDNIHAETQPQPRLSPGAPAYSTAFIRLMQ